MAKRLERLYEDGPYDVWFRDDGWCEIELSDGMLYICFPHHEFEPFAYKRVQELSRKYNIETPF